MSSLLQRLWCIQVSRSDSWSRAFVHDFYRKYFLFLVAKQNAAVEEMTMFLIASSFVLRVALAVVCHQPRQPLAG